jgi:PTH1 family peptidyl-tRNA hydrolase
VLTWLWRRLFGAGGEDPLAGVARGQARLIVGLGNPGPEYAETRHNVGFRCVDRLAQRLGVGWARCDASLVGVGGEQRIVLAKPQTFMNRSGPAVASLLEQLDIPPAQALIVYDDMDLPFAALRLRASGSAGTHNGMRSVLGALGTQDVARLRIGISQAGPGRAIDHVLSAFTADERMLIEPAIERAAEAALAWAKEGAEVAMNRYNRS